MLHNSQRDFIKRHIGPSDEDQLKMLKELGFNSLDNLIDKTVPENIQFRDELSIGDPNSEYEKLFQKEIRFIQTLLAWGIMEHIRQT
jgi:glycine dehydrogenase